MLEVRVSRIISLYYDHTRREADEFIQQGRVTVNGVTAQIGAKATVEDDVVLDGVRIPLEGIFRKAGREQHARKEKKAYLKAREENPRNAIFNPKSSKLRHGPKDYKRKRRSTKDPNQ